MSKRSHKATMLTLSGKVNTLRAELAMHLHDSARSPYLDATAHVQMADADEHLRLAAEDFMDAAERR